MVTIMRAGTASEHGLVVQDVPFPPAPGPDQLLVKVHAAGMNRADLNAAKGTGVGSKESWGRPIGMEWAGEVVATGEAVTAFRPGDTVACSGTGGYAEYALCDVGRAVAFDPSRVPAETAASLPLALMTAHNALVTAGGFRQGDTVLVHGGSSAVGLAAIRVSRLLGAGRVIATSTNSEKRSRLGEFGADQVIDPTKASWSDEVLETTKGIGAGVVIDMITGPLLNETMRATAILGRIVNVGRLGGTSARIDLDLHALRRIIFVGVTFRSRSVDEIREINRLVAEELWPFVERGELALPIERAFPLEQAAAAHAMMAANRHFGKIVLKP